MRMTKELIVQQPDSVAPSFNTALDGLNVPVQTDANHVEPTMARRKVLSGLASLLFGVALDPCPSPPCNYPGERN